MSALIELCRTWVRDKYGRSAEHLLKAEEWLRRIEPAASQAMLLAALTHDMERAFPGPDSPQLVPARGPADPVYNQAHSQRSARIVGEFLRAQQAPGPLVEEVESLIRAHEIGGWPQADSVQAADSLSFLEVNIDFFLERLAAPRDSWPPEYVRAKFEWMYQRMTIPAARALAAPYYARAMQKLQRQLSTQQRT
jgi:hypothetical protein